MLRPSFIIRRGIAHYSRPSLVSPVSSPWNDGVCSFTTLPSSAASPHPNTAPKEKSHIVVFAGEVSGDHIGQRLLTELSTLSGSLVNHDDCTSSVIPRSFEFSGVGGEGMINAGLDTLFPMSELSVMGFTEVLPHLRALNDRIQQAVEHVVRAKPQALVLIDAKGFNLRVAKEVRQVLGDACPPIIQVVAPSSLWAAPWWKSNPAGSLSTVVDHVMCLFPWELGLLTGSVDASFIGTPMLESFLSWRRGLGLTDLSPEALRESCRDVLPNRQADQLYLSVMPGSRKAELAWSLPLFGQVLDVLSTNEALPTIVPVVISADQDSHIENTRAVREDVLPSQSIVVKPSCPSERFDILHATDAALAVSGSATVDTCLARLPTVVTYQASMVSGILARLLTNLQYASLPNIALHRRKPLGFQPLFPELLFENCTVDQIVETMCRQLMNPPSRSLFDEACRELATDTQDQIECIGFTGAAKIIAGHT